MPKLYEYLGIVIFFWSDEHEPIHVHGRYQGEEIKAEFIMDNGKIKDIHFKNIYGKKRFNTKRRKDFETFVKHFSEEIVNKWISYFVWKKEIKSETITKRIK